MSYEDFLINEANYGTQGHCSACEQNPCVCEELCDYFRETVGYSGSDVRDPAESESYTHEEATIRRKEWHND